MFSLISPVSLSLGLISSHAGGNEPACLTSQKTYILSVHTLSYGSPPCLKEGWALSSWVAHL